MQVTIPISGFGAIVQVSNSRDNNLLVEIICEQAGVSLRGDDELQAYLEHQQRQLEKDWQKHLEGYLKPELEEKLSKMFGPPPHSPDIEVLLQSELTDLIAQGRDAYFEIPYKHSLFIEDPLDQLPQNQAFEEMRREDRAKFLAEVGQPTHMALARAELEAMMKPHSGEPTMFPFDLHLSDSHVFCLLELGKSWRQKTLAEASSRPPRAADEPMPTPTPEQQQKATARKDLFGIFELLKAGLPKMRVREKQRLLVKTKEKVKTLCRRR